MPYVPIGTKLIARRDCIDFLVHVRALSPEIGQVAAGWGWRRGRGLAIIWLPCRRRWARSAAACVINSTG